MEQKETTHLKRLVIKKKFEHTTRIKTYSIEEIFTFLRDNPFPYGRNKQYYVDSEGNRMAVKRARVFLEKGIECKCGLRGSFFALESHRDGSFHLDLFAKDEVGDDVLMTIDHIHPASKGGSNTIGNYDPMCKVCNEEKSDKI
ncbi:MAG: HNH endonuclease [bacterium]|nr:HNH endonuclease [bacterium]